MAFVSLIFTARSLKKYKNILIEEKLDAIQAQKDLTKKKFKFRHICIDVRESFKKFFKRLFRCQETSCWYRNCYELKHEGSYKNYFFKSFIGFFSGVLLTYFLYFVFIFQLNVQITSATIICAFLGCILTIGLAFSSNIRCIVLLTLPQFFSKRGRQALMAYAFILALTGPAQNTLNNLGILNESLACGQEQLKQAVKQIIDVIKKPFMAIKEAIKKVIRTVKEIVKKIKEILLKIKRIVMAIVRVIKSVFEFLGKMINICNKELGTPFERCTRVFENAIADCNAKLGPLFNWLCSLAYIVKAVCYIVKIFDYICMIVDFISNSIVGVIIRKIKIFVRHIKTMFYVRIRFAHSFKYKTVASKSVTEIAKEIVKEVKARSQGIVAFFNFMTSASMLFFTYLIFQVIFYRFKYLTSEKFDNIYITKNFRKIDQRRAKTGKETVLPLTKSEQQTYVPIASAKLVRSERRSLSKNITKLATASVKLGTHMAADYSLYWVLNLISHHARYQSKVQAPNFPVAHITGEGFLAKLLRSIVNAFQPVGIKLEIDTVPCLPIPIPPDFDRYIQIGITIAICWILTVFEPYGLRLRNAIMGYYYPLRAKQRTIWLYNHILRSRVSFLLLARRKLRKKFGLKGQGDEISCKQLLRTKLRICFGRNLEKSCLLCAEIFKESEKSRFIKCSTPGCPGLFCLECFESLKNICPVCLSPIEYGDIEDEEKDSSGDESPPKYKKKRSKCLRWLPCGKIEDDDEKQSLIQYEKNGDQETEPLIEEIDKHSDSCSDYSYSYQYDDDNKEPLQSPQVWKDVEMQTRPDEASMESFREENEECLCVDLDNQIRVPKGHAALIKLNVKIDQNEEIELQTFNSQSDETYCQCDRHVEFIGVSNELSDVHKKVKRLRDSDMCNCSEQDLRKSTMSTTMRSDCRYCNCSDTEVLSILNAGTETVEELHQEVPALDLSFVDDEDLCQCQDDNPVLSNRFNYVNFQEICETSPRIESSSAISSLQQSPEFLLRKRVSDNKKNSLSPFEDVSPSSINSLEFKKAQQTKVKQYYQITQLRCDESKCRSKSNKTHTISDMLKKFLFKRKKRANNYLPIHAKDIDDTVEVQSYNYKEENWDTLNLSTPTYPFGSEISSEVSDEEQQLIGDKRIRGGECNHLIDCRLASRCCPDLEVKPYHIKDHIRLKDLSTLSLPPISRPANTREVFVKVFSYSEPSKVSMKASEVEKTNQEQEKLSIPRTAISTGYFEQIGTPGSSDSALSETTCVELFGSPCPEVFARTSHASSRILRDKSIKELPEEEAKEERQLVREEVSDSIIKNSAEKEQLEFQKEDASVTSRPSVKTEESSQTLAQVTSEKPLESSRTSKQVLVDQASFEKRLILQPQTNSSRSSLGEPSSRPLSKLKSTQLNQLLYKDERTEISLVQKINPERASGKTQTVTIPTVVPQSPRPTVKLQISLHNSIVPEKEISQDPIVPRSLRSEEKMVEAKDSFKLCTDWDNCHGKFILSNDKIQQTSENDLHYRAHSKPIRSTDLTTPDKHCQRLYYSSELPEKEFSSSCTNGCKCSVCLMTLTQQQQQQRLRSESASENYSQAQNSICHCCKCMNHHLRPRRTNVHNHQVTPRTTDSDYCDFFPPPPPPPLPMHASKPRRYRNCTCCYMGDYSHPVDDDYNTMFEKSDEDPYLTDLPYQNKDDYLGLVEELQDTLHSRNRNRVRRTMKEFEMKSKQNKPLEKPIIDYDETSESEEPLMRKLEKKICCTSDKCNCTKGKMFISPIPRRGNKLSSHWTIDPSSGEWLKLGKRPMRGRRGDNDENDDIYNCPCCCEHRYQ
ncbi:hypothetical protein ABEB36_003266 [Hypothenemus hampei]|uniref:RING-type domain-containing protein n=1 Tax=Hypothenemus hampei TaxID=57062 RepID=A0ABD1F8Z4_HYPHA